MQQAVETFNTATGVTSVEKTPPRRALILGFALLPMASVPALASPVRRGVTVATNDHAPDPALLAVTQCRWLDANYYDSEATLEAECDWSDLWGRAVKKMAFTRATTLRGLAAKLAYIEADEMNESDARIVASVIAQLEVWV